MDFAASLASNAQRQFNHGYSGFHPWNQDLAEDYNDLLHTSPHVKANPSFAQGFIPNGPDFHQQQAGQVQFDPHHPNSFASSPTQDYTTHNVHQGSPNHYNTFMQQGASTDLTNLGGNFSPCSSPCPGEGVATCCEDDGCEEESGSFYCADNKCSEAEDTCDDERCFPEACVEDACRGLSIPCNDATCFVDMADNHGSYQQYMTQSDAAATLKLLHDNNPSLYTEPHTSYAMESPFLPSHAQQGWLNNTFPPQESCQGVNQIGPETALGLAQHIIAYHEPCNMRDHERPCLADRFQMQFTPRTVCALPKIFASLETGNPAEVMGSEIPIEQQSQVCGITCNDIVKFSQHLFDDHKALINSFSAAHSLENGHPKFVQEDFQMEQYQPTHIESNVLAASLHNPTLHSSAREFMTSSSTSPPSLEQSISMEDTRTDESLTPMTAGHASSSSSPPLEYICSWAMMGSDQVCGSTFDSASNLHEHCVHTHVRSWDRPSPSGWTCKWADCTRHDPFPTKSKLERHMQVHSQCKWKITQPMSLKIMSWQLTTLAVKPVNCPICGLSLSAVQALNQHMRIHTGEKPWECKYCDMSFKQQSALSKSLG